MTLIPKLIFEVTKTIAAKASDRFFERFFKDGKYDIKHAVKDLPSLFETHLIELINWSSEIPFMNIHKPFSVESATIELGIQTSISKFDQYGSEQISENDLLTLHQNILLLGHPGAGKTTTLKRIILKYFVDGYENCDYDFPILLRFRDFSSNVTIGMEILSLL